MKIFAILLLAFSFALGANSITPSKVYSQVMIVENEVEFLLKYYGIKYDKNRLKKDVSITSNLLPRNIWQKSYEILIKINILRNEYGLPTVEPVNITPVLNLNPDLVYGMTQRILTEINIFKIRNDIVSPKFEKKIYKNKTPVDVFNGLSIVSLLIDKLNKNEINPSFVFGENMRVYDDITLILQQLKIQDKTIPAQKIKDSTPKDTFRTAMKILTKIKQLEINAGLTFVDFSQFKKESPTLSDVFELTQMILAELQTVKAYLGIETITPGAIKYKTKTAVEVNQLMSWNLRKLELIKSLNIGGY